MPSSGINTASVEEALGYVDEADATSLLTFFKQLKYLITNDRQKGRVIPFSTLGPREVFEIFSLTNGYTDFGRYRHYDVPEIKLNLSQRLKPSADELLRSIANVWPQCNGSNVRIFVSLLIHFSVEQINSEMELNAGSEASSSSDRLNVPSSPQVAPATPSRKLPSSLKSSIPVTLKAYTEALVS